jgi:hypothetical protein
MDIVNTFISALVLLLFCGTCVSAPSSTTNETSSAISTQAMIDIAKALAELVEIQTEVVEIHTSNAAVNAADAAVNATWSDYEKWRLA